MTMVPVRALLVAAAAHCVPPVAAHLMPAQNGTVNLVGESAYVLVSLPVSALGGDDDADGMLSTQELRAHHAALVRRATQGFRLRDGDAPAKVLMLQLIAEPDSPQAPGATHVVMMATFRFAAPPADLHVETDLFGARDEERKLALRAIRGKDKDQVMLTPLRSAQGFFQPGWRKAMDFVLAGWRSWTAR